MKVRIFTDLGDGFFIGDAEAFLDDESTRRDAATHGGSAHGAGGEVGLVVSLDEMPGDEGGGFYPAVLRIELAAEGKIKVGQFRLLVHTIHA